MGKQSYAVVLLGGAMRLVHRAPPRLTMALALGLARPLLALWPQGRQAMAANLSVLCPQASASQREAMARATLGNYLAMLRGLADLWADPDRVTAAFHPPSGWARLRDEARGGGALLATAHFGGWDAGARWLAREGVPLAALVDPLTSAIVDELMQRLREAGGIELIRCAPAETRRVLHQTEAALRRGAMVGVLVDRPLHRGGVPVSLCGAPTRWPGGVARLALRSGVPLLVGVTDGVLSTLVRLPTNPANGEAPQAGERRLMQAVADELGPIFQAHPTQWYMFRRVWGAPSAERIRES